MIRVRFYRPPSIFISTFCILKLLETELQILIDGLYLKVCYIYIPYDYVCLSSSCYYACHVICMCYQYYLTITYDIYTYLTISMYTTCNGTNFEIKKVHRIMNKMIMRALHSTYYTNHIIVFEGHNTRALSYIQYNHNKYIHIYLRL